MTQKEHIKKHFEENMLDGDEVQGGQMISSESVLEYIEESYVLRGDILKALNSEELVNVMIKMERERIKEALGIGEFLITGGSAIPKGMPSGDYVMNGKSFVYALGKDV